MTRLAEVKAERDRAIARTHIVQMAATLALRSAADHIEYVIDPTMADARYIISAYGLTRCDGGYVIVAFDCPGQAVSFDFYLFDDWRQNIAPDFAIAAEHIGMMRYRLLETVA